MWRWAVIITVCFGQRSISELSYNMRVEQSSSSSSSSLSSFIGFPYFTLLPCCLMDMKQLLFGGILSQPRMCMMLFSWQLPSTRIHYRWLLRITNPACFLQMKMEYGSLKLWYLARAKWLSSVHFGSNLSIIAHRLCDHLKSLGDDRFKFLSKLTTSCVSPSGAINWQQIVFTWEFSNSVLTCKFYPSSELNEEGNEVMFPL